MSRGPRVLLTLLALASLPALGCATRSAERLITIAPGEYGSAFDAARDALRDLGFELDRVDARAGVLTTAPRASAGIATPWIPHARTPGEAVDATIHPGRCIAIVEFATLSTEPSRPPGGTLDLREYAGVTTARVHVLVYRLQRTGRHLDTTAIRFANWWRDPSDPEPVALTPVAQSDPLAGEIARSIAHRMNDGVGRATRQHLEN